MNHTCQTFTKKAIVLLTIILTGSLTFSQSPVMIRGIVQNEKGEKLTGVAVTATNAKTKFSAGTNSDSSGIFEFVKLPAGSGYSFSFSSLGYEPLTMSGYTIKPDITLTLAMKLKEQSAGSSEVVVTGYTRQRKKDLTGAVSVVRAGDLQSAAVAGFDQALEGKVAGVNVLSSRQPGGGVAIRIRGFGTINNNDPLYILDGIPVTGNVSNINPDDIETLQVLKDASSASIYGARAANGVVIITTRTGKPGKNQLIYDGYIGTQRIMNLPTLTNSSQYGQLWFTALANASQGPPAGNPYGTGSQPVIPAFLNAANTTPSGNTDWFSEITAPAVIQSHTASFLNGNEKGQTAFNVGYYDQKGVLKYSSGFTRYSARFNSDYTYFKRLKVGEFASVVNTESQAVSENSAIGSAINSVYFADPILPVYDINGNYSGPPANMPIGGRNPLSSLHSGVFNYAKTWRVLGKVFADMAISNGLNITTSYAVDYTNYNSKSFNPTFSEGTQTNSTNTVSYYNSYTFNTTWTNTVTYKKTIGRHALDILGGTEFIHGVSKNIGAARSALPSNDINIQQINAGTLAPTNSGTGVENALFSLFGKVNYIYADRYLASFTLRKDASSRLPVTRNSQVFPAFSLGWRISDESFFSNIRKTISELKLRGGWGQTGNQEIPDYSYFSTYAPNLSADNSYYDIGGTNTGAVTGYTQNRIGNPLLRWETSSQTNIGLDLTAFNSRFSLSVDVFEKQTKDLLVQPPLPATFGAATPPFINGGSMSNRGIEIEAGYSGKAGPDFSFSVSGNFSYMKNKLTALSSDLSFIASPVSNKLTRNFELQRSVVGLPIASFYGYKMIGIFQDQDQVNNYVNQPGKAVGHFIYQDIDGNGVIDDKDRTFLGSPIPTVNYGWNLKVKYRKFDCWLFVQGVSGNQIFDFTRVYSDFFSSPSASNKNIRILNAWSSTNPTNAGPPILTTNSTSNDTRPSNYFIQDGSYLRLKTLQVGYTFAKNLFKNNNTASLRLYLQVQNLFTITGYKGMDPEIGLQDYGNSNRNLDMGVDRGLYPAFRTYILGVNLKLQQ